MLDTSPEAAPGRTAGPGRPHRPPLDHLDWLEAEAIHVMREVAGQCSNPVLLFSGGKDSICLLRLAEKAFRPARFPFPLLHVDTGHNYPEVIAFRDARAAELEAYLAEHRLPNEWDYFDPAKADEKRECGLHADWGRKAVNA